ncbi:MAG TPA: hypothetical protein DCP47_01450 [Phycisphaerales bacterium]|nr:hypothetical protein [Phycisphaerales bacterium]
MTATLKKSSEQRKISQMIGLEAKRRPGSPMRAYKLIVAYFDTNTFRGWHAFLQTYGGRDAIWIDGHKKELIGPLICYTSPLRCT